MRFLPNISAVLFVAVALASGQDAAPAKPQNELPTFKSKAELVLVPVVVSDKNGAHVHGLKKEDFAVVEDQKEKEFLAFEAVHTEPRVMQLANAHDVFTNTVKPEATQARVTIVVLDTLNTAFLDQNRAKVEILKFLSHLEPGEPVALLNLSKSGLHVIHDFTADPKILAAAVAKVRGEMGIKDTEPDVVSENLPALGTRARGIQSDLVPADEQAITSSEANRLSGIETQTEGVFASIQQSYSVRVTLECMRELAKAFTGVPGRKSVIWATGGIPFSVDDPSRIGFLDADLLPIYESAWRELNNANMAVYPLEVTALTNPAYYSPSISGRRALRT